MPSIVVSAASLSLLFDVWRRCCSPPSPLNFGEGEGTAMIQASLGVTMALAADLRASQSFTLVTATMTSVSDLHGKT